MQLSAPSGSTITLLILAPLLVWRAYSRFKRMVGPQRLSRARPWITLTIFPALVALLCLANLSHPERLWLLAAGLAAGGSLGIFGLRMTRFERTQAGPRYTPNAHLGIALSLLFAARIVYRIIEVYVLDPEAVHGLGDFAKSSLTLGIFGLLAGYYIAYAVGLVCWWRANVSPGNGARRQEESMENQE